MTDRNQYYRDLRQWYINAGICYTCKTRHVVNGETRCLICKMDNRERCKAYAKNRSEESRRKQNIKSNVRKERLKAAGICVDCGKYNAENGRIRCGICLAKDRARHKQRNIDAGKVPQELRANGIYCNMCCRPICNGEKLCPECYKKACKGLEIARTKVNRTSHPWRKIITADIMEARANKYDRDKKR